MRIVKSCAFHHTHHEMNLSNLKSFVLSLFLVGCYSAIYEEQLGEFDWQRYGLGFIEKSLSLPTSVVVSTQSGILASLSASTGELNWRVALPTRNSVDSLLKAKEQVIGLSSATTSNNKRQVTVRGWSISDGSLMWEVYIGNSYTNGSSTSNTDRSDIMYHNNENLLTVLHENTLYFIHPADSTASVLESSWSWNADDDLEAVSMLYSGVSDASSISGHSFVLSRLIIPTTMTDVPNGSRPKAAVALQRVAVGCFVAKSSADSTYATELELDDDLADSLSYQQRSIDKCSGATGVLKFGKPSTNTNYNSINGGNPGKVQLELFPPMEQLNPQRLYAVVGSVDLFGYVPDDVLFGHSLGGENVMSILSLESKQLTFVPYELLRSEQEGTSTAAVTDVRSFVFADKGEIRPASTICWAQSTTGGTASGSYCSSFLAEISNTHASAAASEPQAWSLTPLYHSDSTLCGHDTSPSQTASSLIYAEPFSYYDGLVAAIHCIEFSTSSDSKDGRWLEDITVSGSATDEKRAYSSSLRAEMSALHLATASLAPTSNFVRYASVTKRTVPSFGAVTTVTGEMQVLDVLLVLNSGVTTMIRAPALSAEQKKIIQQQRKSGSNEHEHLAPPTAQLLWTRNEALSQVKQAVIVQATAAMTDASSATNKVPDFTQRLELQKLKLMTSILRAGDSFVAMMAKYGIHIPTSMRPAIPTNPAQTAIIPLPRKVDKLELFGFDKLAVCLSMTGHTLRNSGSDDSTREPLQVRFSELQLQVIAVDLLSAHQGSNAEIAAAIATAARTGNIIDHDAALKWKSVLTLSPPTSESELHSNEDPIVTFAKIIPGPGVGASAPRRLAAAGASHTSTAFVSDSAGGATSGSSVLVVIGTEDGNTYLWDLDALTGVGQSAECVDSTMGGCSIADGNSAPSSANSATSLGATHYVSYTASIHKPGTRTVSISASIVKDVVNGAERLTHTILHVPHNANENESSTTVGIGELTDLSYGLPSAYANIGDNQQHEDATLQYYHHLDRRSGTLSIYKRMSIKECLADASRHQGRLLLCSSVAETTASTVFAPEQESILTTSYPNALDPVHSRFSILGDDSVLIKYLNPHIVAITSISTNQESDNTTGGPSAVDSTVYLTLVDTTTGKIITRLTLESASTPVHSLIVENHVVVTYWNTKAKRTELSSIALYEGVLDAYELSPLATSRVRGSSGYYRAAFNNLFYGNTPATASVPGGASGSCGGGGICTVRQPSAYGTITPLAMQKTYVLPRSVAGLHHTVTSNGVANKNILVSLRNGQIFSLDFRQIHPRRPMSEPTKAEKEEGLQRYSPFVNFNPVTALTHNYTLSKGVATMVSVSSRLESSSVVLSFGGESLDMHLNRVLPSQGFDLLSSDFNHGLLVAILLGLATTVMMLRNMLRKKQLNSLWL